MNAYTALMTRRTVHHFSRDPVPREVLTRALEAAIRAPNHKLTWPWRFWVLGREVREPMADLQVSLKTGSGGAPDPGLVERIRDKIVGPPWCVVVGCVRSEDPFRQREDLAAVACAVQNLQIALHSEGVGSKWSTGTITRRPEVFEALAIDSDAIDIVGFVWVGHAKQPVEAPSRPPLSEFVTDVG